MNEQHEYEIIKELVDHGSNKERAALALGCSRRTIDRYVAGYKAEGKAYFVHGNRGRAPAHALGSATRQDIAGIYTNKYCDANFAHFAELAAERDGIAVSEGTVRNIMKEAGDKK